MQLSDVPPEVLLRVVGKLEELSDVLAFRICCRCAARAVLDAAGWRALTQLHFGSAADAGIEPLPRSLQEAMRAYAQLANPLVPADNIGGAWTEDNRFYIRQPMHSRSGRCLLLKGVWWLDLGATFPAVRPGQYVLEASVMNQSLAYPAEVELSWEGSTSGSHKGSLNLRPSSPPATFWMTARPCEPFTLPPAEAGGQTRRVECRILNIDGTLKRGLVIEHLRLRRLPGAEAAAASLVTRQEQRQQQPSVFGRLLGALFGGF